MRPTAFQPTPIFHPCAKPDVKLYRIKIERGREKKAKERWKRKETTVFEKEGDGQTPSLLYIYTNEIIPAVLAHPDVAPRLP